jgi:hypothetical protein
MTALWEHEQEDLHGDDLLSGISRESSDFELELHRNRSKRQLSDPSRYIPEVSNIVYSEDERAIAMALALAQSESLSYAAAESRDFSFEADGCTDVKRYELKDGSVGYFKSFTDNSRSEGLFREFGTSSLGASINELSAHRMAQALGPGFDELVPETVLRELDGKLGTLQREVKEDDDLDTMVEHSPELQEDYRKAAILDFVIGNLDRHEDNYLLGAEIDAQGVARNRVRLIDNSFSFPAKYSSSSLNASVFASNEGLYGLKLTYTMDESELKLKWDELSALRRARASTEGWVAEGTMDPERGARTVERIDHLLSERRLTSFTEYYIANGGVDPETL